MIRYLYILFFFPLIACSNIDKSSDRQSKKNDITESMSSNNKWINDLISKENSYENHFIVDIDNDSETELIIICKSDEKSDCISPMFETSCVYLVLSIYERKSNDWKRINRYKLPDFENTLIKIDSISNLVVTQFSQPSGHSKQKKTEIYQFLNNGFYLKTINLSIGTKLFSGYGTSRDDWEYLIDLETKSIEILYSTLRLIEVENGSQELVSTDSTITSKLTKTFSIKLADEYLLDTLIGEGNMIFHY